MKTPLALIILDGWGVNDDAPDNAITQARTPQWDAWWENHPHCLLEASGHCVGLPDKQMGNSEVGHMHIGAGRIIEQDFTRINHAIDNGQFARNDAFLTAITKAKQHNKTIHLMGLLSPGGVHSHENHLFSLLELLKARDVPNTKIHAFLDGRDTPPKSARHSLETLEGILKDSANMSINSITGRYYAMDRDTRWERVRPVYELLTQSTTQHHAATSLDALSKAYEQDISDEFIPPTLIGQPGHFEDGDQVIFFNFRADRARQLAQALTERDFTGFKRLATPRINLVTMTQYSQQLTANLAFPPLKLTNTLGEVIAANHLKQLRLAETEKYAHVTFFLNGGSDVVYEHEERQLIPSPRVTTYDLQPSMSAKEITTVLIDSLMNRRHDVILCNFANADMVGHTGNIPKTIEAIECLDHCLSLINDAIIKHGGELLITADHGNAETLFNNTTNQAHTAHTNHPVPLLYVGRKAQVIKPTGGLTDVAPSVLHLLGIEIPQEMKGQALFEVNNDH